MAYCVCYQGTFLFIWCLLILSLKCSNGQTVTGLFVFGDSQVDVGNNNFLPLSIIKANFPHYGIDFPRQIPTGRFSNGKNVADLFAEKLSLPSPPPYLSLQNKGVETGVNFASGGSGILNGTVGAILCQVITLTQQVDYYATVHQDLLKKLGPDAAKTTLSKSLFFMVTGSNDIRGYSLGSDLQQYLDSMILTLKQQIKRLHSYNARKFVFPGVPKLGCLPSERIKSATEACNEDLNSWSVKYNERLKPVLQQLKSELIDINYLYFDSYSVSDNIIQKPATYGFKEIKAACCGSGKLNSQGPCNENSAYCPNRRNHVFWDHVHPTQATYQIWVDNISNDSSSNTFPISLRDLIAA